MNILAIDPGELKSGYVIWNPIDEIIVSKGILENIELLNIILKGQYDCAFVEMVASYGMSVGKNIFETVVWIGRFIQCADIRCKDIGKVYRKDVKMHLCHTMKAKDSNIRQALIDRFGPPGVKKAPGKLYKVRSHEWAALAVAVYSGDIRKR